MTYEIFQKPKYFLEKRRILRRFLLFLNKICYNKEKYWEEIKMAFENGNNMFDYCGELFERYRKDNMIFYKGLQILSQFQSRTDYPYCTQELSQVFKKIFGYNLDHMTDCLWKYSVRLSDEMIWDARDVLEDGIYKNGNMIEDLSKEEGDRLVKMFQDEMQSFFISTTPFFEELFDGDGDNISGLDRIAVKKTYGDNHVIRFIRKDGENLDISLNKNSLNNLIDALNNLE